MFTVNPSSNTPIYQQIIGQVKEKVLLGLLEPGDKLPSVRELSTLITINPNTIQKAYQELERQQIIATIRGRGTFVAEGYQDRQNSERRNLLREHFRKGVIDAWHLGLSPEEVHQLIDQLLNELDVRRD